MKPDERDLFLAKYHSDMQGEHITLRMLARKMGINENRAYYIATKWAQPRNNWWDYGVGPLAGFFTEKGIRKAVELETPGREINVKWDHMTWKWIVRNSTKKEGDSNDGTSTS